MMWREQFFQHTHRNMRTCALTHTRSNSWAGNYTFNFGKGFTIRCTDGSQVQEQTATFPIQQRSARIFLLQLLLVPLFLFFSSFDFFCFWLSFEVKTTKSLSQWKQQRCLPESNTPKLKELALVLACVSMLPQSHCYYPLLGWLS